MEILKKVQEYLLSKGFKQESDLVYSWEKGVVAGTIQQLSPDGKMVSIPLKAIRKVEVEFYGPGYVKGDDEKEEPFEEIRFRVEDLEEGGKGGTRSEIIEGFYEEDFELVKARIDGLINL